MRPSYPCWRPLLCQPAGLLGLVLLVGLAACGSPSPDGPVSSSPTGSADAVVSFPAGAGSGANDPRRPGAPSTTRPGASNRDPAQPGAPVTNDPRAAPPAPEARVPPAAASATPPPSDAQTPAEQAQREARERWFAELRESPDATVRLQALALWAQQPGDTIIR
jgi:hypothetical protein